MFQPVVPTGGLAGWRFLQKTYDLQREAFNQSAQLNRETDYFRDNIGKVTSARELVDDRQLLSVALGAFRLQDDINNKFFIQKMLEEGTTADDALANRFTDKRYKDLSEAFGFGPNEFSPTAFSSFAERIVNLYETASFEVATGNVDETLRIALRTTAASGRNGSLSWGNRRCGRCLTLCSACPRLLASRTSTSNLRSFRSVPSVCSAARTPRSFRTPRCCRI